MGELSEAQKFALDYAPFVVTGPWPWRNGSRMYGIQTVEQDWIRWDLRPNWSAPIRRLIRKGLLTNDDGVYRKPAAMTAQQEG